MNDPIRILGVPGSLRRHSYNRGLLRAAVDAAPEGVVVEIADLSALPLYNQDLEGSLPPPVSEWWDRVRAADALLIASPEHNFSVPAALKNAIDWATRAPGSILKQKPIALMGATPGGLGTVRAQMALRQVLLFPGASVLVKPELLVSQARDKFDAEGNLTDEKTRGLVGALVEALAAWTRLLRNGAAPA